MFADIADDAVDALFNESICFANPPNIPSCAILLETLDSELK